MSEESKPVEVLGRDLAVNDPHHPPVHPATDAMLPANGDAYEDWSGYGPPDTDIPYEEDGPWNDQPF